MSTYPPSVGKNIYKQDIYKLTRTFKAIPASLLPHLMPDVDWTNMRTVNSIWVYVDELSRTGSVDATDNLIKSNRFIETDVFSLHCLWAFVYLVENTPGIDEEVRKSLLKGNAVQRYSLNIGASQTKIPLAYSFYDSSNNVNYYLAAVKDNQQNVMQLLRGTLYGFQATPNDRTTVLVWDDKTADEIIKVGLKLPTQSVLIKVDYTSTQTGLEEPNMKIIKKEEGIPFELALKKVGYED